MSRALAFTVAWLSSTVTAAETTTTVMRRVVGEPLPSGVVPAAGIALLVFILVAGLLARRRH